MINRKEQKERLKKAEEIGLEKFVIELNEIFFENNNGFVGEFIYHSTGYDKYISFQAPNGEFSIWNGCDDEREFYEDINEWEEMYVFIRRKFAMILREISSIKI